MEGNEYANLRLLCRKGMGHGGDAGERLAKASSHRALKVTFTVLGISEGSK